MPLSSLHLVKPKNHTIGAKHCTFYNCLSPRMSDVVLLFPPSLRPFTPISGEQASNLSVDGAARRDHNSQPQFTSERRDARGMRTYHILGAHSDADFRCLASMRVHFERALLAEERLGDESRWRPSKRCTPSKR